MHGTLRFLYFSHLLYGICVKIFIMNRYISKSYTTSKNTIDRQYTAISRKVVGKSARDNPESIVGGF